MTSKSDAQLLGEYARQKSEPAFAELVARYTNLVYAAALRQTDSANDAAEVTQEVFIVLARTARELASRLETHATLAGWLCRSARNLSLNLRRDEWRRHARERLAMESLNALDDPPAEWERVRPLLDDALSELNNADYDALVMRFFQNLDFRSIGHALGASDDTAQKRVSRALEKLRESLSRRGVTAAAGALAAVLSANASELAPAALATEIARAALAAAAAAGGATGSTLKGIIMTTLQKSAAVVLVVAAIGAALYEARLAARWKARVGGLEQSGAAIAGQIAALRQSKDDMTNRLAGLAAQNAVLQSDAADYARLRRTATLSAGEPDILALGRKVAVLRQKLAQMPEKSIPELRFLTTKDWADVAAEADLTTDDGVRLALCDLRGHAMNTFLNDMMKAAMTKYLAANNDVLPTDLLQLKPFFDQPVTDEMLQRYRLLQSGVPDDHADLVELAAPPVDPDYYSTHAMSIAGAHGGQVNVLEREIETAAMVYANANNGQMPADPSQVAPYLNQQVDPATIQKYLTKVAANPPPADAVTVSLALNAYQNANAGQDPSSPLQIIPYLTTAAEQSAFLRLEQAPPQALALAPALSAYFAAHNGQAPQSVADLSPYVTTAQEQAGLQAVKQMKNPWLK